MVRWPGKIKAGSVSNDIMHHMDWMPTFVAAAGDDGIKEKLLKGYSANGKKFKVHLDGYNYLIKRMGLGGRMRQFALHSIFTKQDNHFHIEVPIFYYN